jgi:hypothetical protein
MGTFERPLGRSPPGPRSHIFVECCEVNLSSVSKREQDIPVPNQKWAKANNIFP